VLVSRQDAEKVTLLTRPTLAVSSPTHHESAEAASWPRDAPFPMHRSRPESILNVAHSEHKLSWQLGAGG